MSKPDLWEDTGAFHYRHLPEGNLDAFFTEERDMLTISFDLGKWWMGETGTVGQMPYNTLEEAKAAGDEQIDDLESKQDAALLHEAGLDPKEWKITYQEGVRFDRIDGTAGIYAVDQEDSQCWDVYARTDDPIATDVSTIAEALKTIADATSPEYA